MSASRRVSGNAALVASAMVLGGLIVTQASKLAGEPARGDVVSSTGALTTLAFEAQNEDMLAVLDGRTEQLLLYRVVNKTGVELVQSYSVPRMFMDAHQRAGTGGRK
jgi:hypothetical protein